MKLEVTLTSDEYAALSEVPGRSAPQRMRWLIKFWAAVKAEHDKPVVIPAGVEFDPDIPKGSEVIYEHDPASPADVAP